MSQISPSRRPGIDHQLIAAECDHTIAQLRWALDRACLRRSWQNQARQAQWAEEGYALMLIIVVLWLARCRGGGLNDSCRWYRAAQQEWLAP